MLRVQKLSENATIPRRQSTGAAGYDLSRCVLESFRFHAAQVCFESFSLLLSSFRRS